MKILSKSRSLWKGTICCKYSQLSFNHALIQKHNHSHLFCKSCNINDNTNTVRQPFFFTPLRIKIVCAVLQGITVHTEEAFLVHFHCRKVQKIKFAEKHEWLSRLLPASVAGMEPSKLGSSEVSALPRNKVKGFVLSATPHPSSPLPGKLFQCYF